MTDPTAIAIPAPRGQAPACSTCGPLAWLYSKTRGAWVAFVPDPVDRDVLRVHKCAHAQHPPTWRQLPHGDPPNDLYVEAKNKITGRSVTHLHEEEHE